MRWYAVLAGLCLAGALAAQDLSVRPEDLRIEQRGDSGYHLFVRKKPGLSSILLTETTKDPERRADNYAYRAIDYNPVNGDEKRMLDGAIIPADKKLYSLIDSSEESDSQFGQAFHIFIPYVVEYGYSWTRSGQSYMVDGSFINIRTFAKPFADYSGGFSDNPYQIRLRQKSAPAPVIQNYLGDAVKTFERISDSDVIYSKGPEDIVDKIIQALPKQGESVDIVLCLDTTESMDDDFAALRFGLVGRLKERAKSYQSCRFGLMLYKDYFEEYLTKRYDFRDQAESLQGIIDTIRPSGGRDIPEAVNEALYASLSEFPWAAKTRVILLVGDAPAHPQPRGKISEKDVSELAQEKSVSLQAIILPK